MAVYAFRARGTNERATSGTLVADSAAAARQLLRDRGLVIEHFAPARLRLPRIGFSRIYGARREEQVAEFARLLAMLLRTNVTLSDGLDVLITQTKGRFEIVLRDVREALDSGSAFAAALVKHPGWFSTLFVEAVRVGEHAGTLDGALSPLAEYLSERRALGTRFSTALAYPLILLVVATGVVLFLMSYVIPQLLMVITASGQPLPTSTRILKTLSDGLIGWWPLLLGIVGICGSAFVLLIRSPRGRWYWHRGLLGAPMLGILIRKVLIARFAQQMAIMLGTGVPFLEALRIVRRSAGNEVLARELSAVEAAVEAGADIAVPLASSRVFPPLVARLVAVGQNSGELVSVLAQLRSGYENEVRVAVTRFMTALEPMLIIAMAAVVGFIVLATLMPILQITRGMA